MEEQKKKKKIASKIVDIILGALIVLILGLQIDMFITKNNNYGIPSLFGYSFMEVLTDSMEGKNPDSFDAGEGVVIQKKQGAPSLYKHMEDIFGNAEKVKQDKGYWILTSEKIV